MYHSVVMNRDKLYTSMGQYTSAKPGKCHTVNFNLYNFTKSFRIQRLTGQHECGIFHKLFLCNHFKRFRNLTQCVSRIGGVGRSHLNFRRESHMSDYSKRNHTGAHYLVDKMLFFIQVQTLPYMLLL